MTTPKRPLRLAEDIGLKRKRNHEASSGIGIQSYRSSNTDASTCPPMHLDLASSEATLSALFQSTDDSIWTVDSKRFALLMFNAIANGEFAKARGFALQTGLTPDDLMPPKEAKWWKESYQRALESGSFETDYKDDYSGEIYHLSFHTLVREGKIFGISVFARNVTARRRAQQELQASLTRYQHLVASSNDWVWELDANGAYTFAGAQCREILGYEPEEMIGKTRFDLMPQGETERVRRLFEACAAERQPFRALENANLHKHGRVVILESYGVPIIDAQGRFSGYRGMDRDITDRKRAGKRLRESEGRLRLALESGRMYAFEWSSKIDRMRRSAECRAVLGIKDYPLEETGKQFLDRIDPSDRQRYMETLRELTPTENKYVTSYRKQLPDGRICWIEARGRGFFDSAGRLFRVVGIASDVTARKESEDARKILSARLINAQEEERKRFARDLHDGVSQSLAVICSEVAQAKAAGNGELSSRLDRLYGKLQDVVSEIEHLSHELHPSTLKHLGLTSAMRYLCREISESHGIDIEFREHGTLQQPSKDVSLCLYRIAQEALQNVVKHSGSKRAWVELGSVADEIVLCIWDEGTGFDTRSEKNGLGLVSMRERLRLVGGRIIICSRRKCGTRVEAKVSLASTAESAA